MAEGERAAFVRAEDGRSDDEGWLLTVVDDANRGPSALYVLDASTMAREAPKRSSACPNACPCAVTESGYQPTATDEQDGDRPLEHRRGAALARGRVRRPFMLCMAI